MRPVELKGKPIAITGAGSGIGRATAIACASAGMPVALMSRRREPLDALAERITASGGRAVVAPGDAADPAANAALLDACASAFGPAYAVFANAGYGFEKAMHSATQAELRDIFEVNFWGSLDLAQRAADDMITRGRGHIIFCSSCLSKIGLPLYGPYCATKACQDHIARAMRHELRNAGVHVSSVHPIGTRTEFFEQAQARSGGALRLMDRSTERFMQPPERVAAAVLRALQKPAGEIWTSLTVRLALAAAVAFPGLADMALARRAAAMAPPPGQENPGPIRPIP